MTNFIPVFPLGIVVYPGEELNLHIFEPKYKQLINDCFETKKPFGIPTVIDGKIVEMGTVVIIKEISNRYDDGQLDIKTEGVQPFKILEFVKEIPEKLYGGAIVNYPQINNVGSPSLLRFILDGIRKLHLSLNVEKVFKNTDEKLLSYDLAHHAGMNLQDEYYLLELELEIHRQEFLKRHIVKLLEVMKEMEALKQKIGLNGHFKNLEGFNL